MWSIIWLSFYLIDDHRKPDNLSWKSKQIEIIGIWYVGTDSWQLSLVQWHNFGYLLFLRSRTGIPVFSWNLFWKDIAFSLVPLFRPCHHGWHFRKLQMVLLLGSLGHLSPQPWQGTTIRPLNIWSSSSKQCSEESFTWVGRTASPTARLLLDVSPQQWSYHTSTLSPLVGPCVQNVSHSTPSCYAVWIAYQWQA